MREGVLPQFVPIDYVINGQITEDAVDYTIQRIETVLRRIGEPVLFARLRLERAPDPARTRPVTLQISLDVNGTPVRAQVAAADVREGADQLQRRLNDQFEQRAEHREAMRQRIGRAQPGQWRHGDLPTARPDYFDRPVEERQLVTHKTFAIGELTPDEAAFDMDQMDFDFYLFRELGTGEDALLERTPDGGYRLTRLHPVAEAPGPLAVDLTLSDTVPATSTVDEARQRLDVTGERFVFFADATTGRGNIVYRRYDGHHGLITPA